MAALTETDFSGFIGSSNRNVGSGSGGNALIAGHIKGLGAEAAAPVASIGGRPLDCHGPATNPAPVLKPAPSARPDERAMRRSSVWPAIIAVVAMMGAGPAQAQGFLDDLTEGVDAVRDSLEDVSQSKKTIDEMFGDGGQAGQSEDVQAPDSSTASQEATPGAAPNAAQSDIPQATTKTGKTMSFSQWQAAVGMPGSCGIACYDALTEICTGSRDSAYRQETAELARRQLTAKQLSNVMVQYDRQFLKHKEYYRNDRSKACAFLGEKRHRKQLAVRFAQQAGHSKFVNPVDCASGADTMALPADGAASSGSQTRSQVSEVQALLNELGYDAGAVDGVMGSNTRRAIADFQRSHGLQPTGQLDDNLVATLRTAATPHASVRGETGPTFDCAKAGTPTEFAICGTPALAALDRRIADSFLQAMTISAPATQDVLRMQQKAWLAQRDACGADVSCLDQTMSARLVELDATHLQVANVAPAAGAIDVGDGSTDFAGTTAEPISVAELGTQAGIPTWNGRLLVKGSSGLSGIPTDDAITQFGHLAAFLALKQFPDIIDNDEWAFAALTLLEDPAQRRIIASAGLDAERVLGVHRYWLQLDEFERRALLEAIRNQATPLLTARAPDLPVPILILCSVSFAEYDFDSERFAFQGSTGRCESIRMNVGGYGEADLGNLHSLTITAPLATEYLPDSVSVPSHQAQDYQRRNLQTDRTWGNREMAVLAVEAQLVGLTEKEPDRDRRNFELGVELEGALLFRPDELTTPFARLPLTPPSSVETVVAAPTGPVPLDDDTLNLMLLARDLVTLDDADIARWAAKRANQETFGGPGPWAPFFPKEMAKELSFGAKAKPLLLANFAEWNRARARALPDTVVLPSRQATLFWLQKNSQPGVARVFDEPGESGASNYRTLAQWLRVPEDRLLSGHAKRWNPNSEGLLGLGPIELVLVLPASRDRFTVPLDQGNDPGQDHLDVNVDLRVGNPRIEGRPPLVVLDVEPVAARVTTRDGTEVGAAAFDAAHYAASSTNPASSAEGNEPEQTDGTEQRPPAEAEHLAQQAAEEKLAALLAGRTGLMMIRRTGTAAIESVYTVGVQGQDYHRIVRDNSLDLPEKSNWVRASEIADILRDQNGAAILVRTFDFIDERKLGVIADPDLRKAMLAIVTELDVVATGFPPDEAEAVQADHAADVATLVPADVRYVMLRRRDDLAPLTRVLVQDDGSGSVFYSSGLREAAPSPYNLDDLNVDIAFELPNKAEGIGLRAIPGVLRDQSGIAVILPRKGLETIFPKVSDLDLVVRRFPPEEFEIGIPKDHTQGAEDFAILGISGGLDEAAALAAVKKEFTPNEIVTAEAGGVNAARGACEIADALAAGAPDQRGTLCLAVGFRDGIVSHVALRQVVSGNAEEAALTALRERYGRSTLTTEVRHLDRGGKRTVLGWGAPLGADRASLGRVDAKTPPTVLEAVVWVENGATTILLHLDDVAARAEVKATQTPEIKF